MEMDQVVGEFEKGLTKAGRGKDFSVTHVQLNDAIGPCVQAEGVHSVPLIFRTSKIGCTDD
jgi:hypothetical protein